MEAKGEYSCVSAYAYVRRQVGVCEADMKGARKDHVRHPVQPPAGLAAPCRNRPLPHCSPFPTSLQPGSSSADFEHHTGSPQPPPLASPSPTPPLSTPPPNRSGPFAAWVGKTKVFNELDLQWDFAISLPNQHLTRPLGAAGAAGAGAGAAVAAAGEGSSGGAEQVRGFGRDGRVGWDGRDESVG